ncbi:hypothetical protein BU17DRAFT_72757 [Hysterangium stoloniferum]|nr:hypothetical protein BU17DRAFT_72757 [Hysterangium stoloniferum]
MNIKAEGDRYKNNTLREWIVEELITFVHIRDVKLRASSSQTGEASTQPKNRFSTPLSTLQSSQDRWRSGIRSGPSTHLLVKKGDGTIWTGKLFCDELNNLDRHLGEMLGARYGTSQPKGLNKLIISDFPVLMELFVQAENRLETWPPGLTATFRSLEKDPTVYKNHNG